MSTSINNEKNKSGILHISNVESIDVRQYAYDESIINVMIDDTVKNIYDSAFENCINLSAVHLPNDI